MNKKMFFKKKSLFSSFLIFCLIILLMLFLREKYYEDHKHKTDGKTTNQNSSQKGGFDFYTSLKEAKKAASLIRNGKKKTILIYFSADWCLPCHKIEKELFPSQEFKDFVKIYGIVLVLYDMDEENPEGNEIASKYSVAGLPTMILTDHKGREIDKVLGFRSVKKTMQELKEVID